MTDRLTWRDTQHLLVLFVWFCCMEKIIVTVKTLFGKHKDLKYIITSALVRIFSPHTHTNTYTHFHPVKTSRSPFCVIPSDLADTVVRSLLSLHSLSQRCLWTQLPRKCNTACLFLWLSGMIRNIIMIKLAGGWGAEWEQRALTKSEQGAWILSTCC